MAIEYPELVEKLELYKLTKITVEFDYFINNN